MSQKSIYPFLISFILLAAVIVINRRSFNKMRNYSRAVDHTRIVITSLEELSDHLKSAQIYSTAVARVTQQEFYHAYRKDAEAISAHLANLKQLVADNPVQFRRMDTISRMIGLHIPVLMEKNIAEIISSGQAWRLNDLFKIHAAIKRAVEREKRLLSVRKKELDTSTNLTGILTVIFSIVAIAIILFAFISNLVLRRRSTWLEGFLASILHTSQNGILTFKAIRNKGEIVDFRVLFANKAMEGLLQINPENVMTQRLSALPSLLSNANVMQQYIEVVETGRQLSFETLFEQGPVKKWFYVLLARLEDGLTASFHDISDIKKYQEELQENIKKLESSNKELEQYAYIASHDLQEPLRKIRTYADFLYEYNSRTDQKSKSYMQKIITAAERMSNLINDILSFSSLKREPAFIKTDLSHVMKNMLTDLDLLISEKHAAVNYQDLPELEAIPLQMHQLFYNLINNSLKFSRPGINPVIQISSRKLDAQETAAYHFDPSLVYHEIVLRDNGIGFRPEFSEQIFGLFKRLGTKSQFAGSGIGLALCRKVVENHHGIIFAEGEQDAGAAFHIILPERQPAA